MNLCCNTLCVAQCKVHGLDGEKLDLQMYVVSVKFQVKTFSSAICFTASVLAFHFLFRHSDIKNTFYVVFLWPWVSCCQNIRVKTIFFLNPCCVSESFLNDKDFISQTLHIYEKGLFQYFAKGNQYIEHKNYLLTCTKEVAALN